MHKNQNGFDVFFLSVAIVLIVGLSFAGWFVYQKNHDKTQPEKTASSQKTEGMSGTHQTPSADTKAAYDAAMVAHIANFDRASASLKDALINIYYGDAKQRCDTENEGVAPAAQTTIYMTVGTVVRDAFASVTFCGADAPSLLANITTGWSNIGSLTNNPSCDLVDQFKISKVLVPTCVADGETTTVTYP